MRSIIAFIFIALTVLCTSIMAQETADYWLQKGNEFYKNDSYDLALRCYDKAIEINPQDANAWHNKGITLKTLGRTTEADAAFAKAKDLTTSTTPDASSMSDADTSDADVSTASKTLSHSGFGSYTFDRQDKVTATVKKGTDPYHMMGISELVSEVGFTRDGTQYIVTSTGKNLHGYIDYSMDGYVVVMKPKKSSLTKGEFMDIINTFQRVTPVELENKITISPESRSREVEPLKITTLRIGYQPHIHMIAEMVAAVKGWWKEDLKPLGIEEIKEFEFPSGPPEMQAMYAGELDVAYVGTAPPIAAISQGLDAKIVAAINVNGSNLVFRTGKDYQSPSSLEGLSIATFPPGSIQDTIIKVCV